MKQRIEDLKTYHTLCKVMSKTQAKCELMKLVNCEAAAFEVFANKYGCVFYWGRSPQGYDFWDNVQGKLQQLEE